MGNRVKNFNGYTLGFRCMRCGMVYESMWGDICNKCRDEKEKLSLLRELSEKNKEG